MEIVSDWKDTLRLLIVEGHKLSGNRPPVLNLLDGNCVSTDDSLTGVDGLGGDGGVEGRFLSAESALFAPNWACEGTVLVRCGDGQRLAVAAEVVVVGEGDLYRELTSLVRRRRVGGAALSALFFSAGTKGGLVVSVGDCLCNDRCDPHTSIKHYPN